MAKKKELEVIEISKKTLGFLKDIKEEREYLVSFCAKLYALESNIPHLKNG